MREKPRRRRSHRTGLGSTWSRQEKTSSPPASNNPAPKVCETRGASDATALGYGAVHPRIALIALTDPGDPDPGHADRYPLPDLAAAGSNSPSSDASESTGTGAPATANGSASAASVRTSWVTPGIGGAVLRSRDRGCCSRPQATARTWCRLSTRTQPRWWPIRMRPKMR